MRCGFFQTLACSFGLSFILTAPIRAAESTAADHSNGLLQLSGRTINLLFQRDVDDTRLIQEVILGASTSGLAHMRGQVTTTLIPDPRYASLEVRLAGTAEMDSNVAERRAVSVLSSAHTAIDARKRVLMDETGLHPQSAEATCTSTVRVNDIESRLQLVERIAWRRATRMLGQLEQAAARQAELRSAQHLDEECDALLGDADKAFREMLHEPLVREGMWPSQLKLHTTTDHVHLSALGAKELQRGAPAGPPRMDSGHDIAVCIHESLINNLGESALSNTTVADRQWLELVKISTGRAPRPLWVHDRSERWQVTFAAERPLTIVFVDKGFTVTLRLDQIARGGQRFEWPLTISTTHQLEIAPEGPKLIRQGELLVQFHDGNDATTAQAELKAFLGKKFGAVFEQEIYFDGLVPPAGASWDILRRLKLSEFAALHGWLVLGYRLAGGEGEFVSGERL